MNIKKEEPHGSSFFVFLFYANLKIRFYDLHKMQKIFALSCKFQIK